MVTLLFTHTLRSELAAKRYTVPSTVGDELTYNPFMRVNIPELAIKVVGT